MIRTFYCLWITAFIQTFITYAQFPPFPFFPFPRPPFGQSPFRPFFPNGGNRQFGSPGSFNPQRAAFQPQRFLGQNPANNVFAPQGAGGFANNQGSNLPQNMDLSRMPDFNSNTGLAAGNRLMSQIANAPRTNAQQPQFQQNRFSRVQSQIERFRANAQLRNRNIGRGFLPQQGRTQITFPPQPPVTPQQPQPRPSVTQRRPSVSPTTQGGQLNFARFPQNPFQLANFPGQFNTPNAVRQQQPVFQPQGVLQFPRPTQQQRTGQQRVIPTAAAAARQTIQQARMQTAFASQAARQNMPPGFPSPGLPAPGFPPSPGQQPTFGMPARSNLVPPAGNPPSQFGRMPGQQQQPPQNPALPQLPRLPTRQFPPPQQQQSLQGLQNLINPAAQQPRTNTGLPSSFPSSTQTEVQNIPGLPPIPPPSVTQTGSSGGLAALAQSQTGSSSSATGPQSPDSLFPQSEALKALGIDPASLDPNTFRTPDASGSTSGSSSSGSSQSQFGTGTVMGPDGKELTTIDPNNIPAGAEVQTLVTIMDDHGNLLYQGVGLSPEEIDKIANEIAQNLTQGNPAGSPPVGIVDTGTVNQASVQGSAQSSSSSSGGGLSQFTDSSSNTQAFDNPPPPPIPSLSDLTQSSSSGGSQSSIIGGSQTFAGGSQQQQQSPSFPSTTVVDFANPSARSSQTGNSDRLFEQFLNNPDQFANTG